MLHYGWQNSSAKYYAFQRLDQLKLLPTPEKRCVLKNEHFASQLVFWSDEDTHYTFDHNRISWRGIHLNTYRIEVSPWKKNGGEVIAASPKVSFVDYVNDDQGRMVSDPLVADRGIERQAGCFQGVWLEGCFDHDTEAGKYSSTVTIYGQKGYDDEIIIEKLNLEIILLDGVMTSPRDSDFFLDLWQHPSNWARTYKVPMWSDAHFYVIRTHLEAMARLGQKVVTLICSDYPWAGQRCYQVMENASNLFEHNMVQVEKSPEGVFRYDFSVIKRYIETAKSVGIESEIDLFGLLGNWDAWSFGNPVEGYRDPMRIKYKNASDGSYGFMSSVDEIKGYIKALFDALNEMGLWDKVRVICDEPDHPESFEENVGFLKALAPEKLKIKSAIHVSAIMPLATEVMDDVSLGLNVLGEGQGDVSDVHQKLRGKQGTLTWYVCCFPSRPNNFLSSPRLENRLIGWLTHYFKLDGFLRWDFAIWPEDPYKNTSYKYPKWTAGDMFFVYPGSNMEPVRSQRLENLFFGIQDYQVLKHMTCNASRELKEEYQYEIEQLLGKKEALRVHDLEVEMHYSLDYEDYMKLRSKMIQDYVMNCGENIDEF